MKPLPPHPAIANTNKIQRKSTPYSAKISKTHQRQSSSEPPAAACGKRKRNPKIFAFHNFPSAFTNLSGAFRDNVRDFLQQCAEREDYNVLSTMPVWCTLLVYHPSYNRIVPIFTIEESVASSPKPPFCDLCRSSGIPNFTQLGFLNV